MLIHVHNTHSMVLCGWLLHEKEHEVEEKNICLNSDKTRKKGMTKTTAKALCRKVY